MALAQQWFLAHQFLEDWGYQFAVRIEVGRAYRAKYGRYDIAPEHLDAVKTEIEAGLRLKLAELAGFADHWRVAPGSIRLLWDRFFEVDFDLESATI